MRGLNHQQEKKISNFYYKIVGLGGGAYITTNRNRRERLTGYPHAGRLALRRACLCRHGERLVRLRQLRDLWVEDVVEGGEEFGGVAEPVVDAGGVYTHYSSVGVELGW